MAQVQLHPAETNEMWQDNPTGLTYDVDTVHVGVQPTIGLLRGLWRFDLSSLPDDYTLIGAKLEINQVQGAGSATRVQLNLTTKPWVGNGNGASWNNYDVGLAWDTPGGDFAESPYVVANVYGPGATIPQVLEIDVTPLVAASTDELAFVMRVTNEASDYCGFTHENDLDFPATLTIDYVVLETGDSTIPMVADVDAMLTRDHFGEQIVYVPAGDSENLRTIDAIIDRDAVETIEGLEPIRTPQLVVTVANDATTGISSSEIDTGTDRVVLPVRFREDPKNLGIARVITHDQGVVVFEVA